MEHEFCPLCGNRCGGVEETAPGDSSVPEDEEVTAAEVVADVAVAALETVAEVVHEHEETDRTAEVADALETMAEESSEVAVAEAIAEDEGGGEDTEHEHEDEEPEEPEVHDETDEEGPEGAPEDETDEETHEEEATPVNAPPQLQEEPEQRARRRSSAPAFRRHRAGARHR